MNALEWAEYTLEWTEYIRAAAVIEPVAMFVLMAAGALFLVLVIAMRDEWRQTPDIAGV